MVAFADNKTRRVVGGEPRRECGVLSAPLGGSSSTWGMVQRYVHGPCGSITILNADFLVAASGTQPMVGNLYRGITLDAVTGLYYERNRDYSASSINGANTYKFVESSPVENVDAAGNWATIKGGCNHGSLNFSAGYPDLKLFDIDLGGAQLPGNGRAALVAPTGHPLGDPQRPRSTAHATKAGSHRRILARI